MRRFHRGGPFIWRASVVFRWLHKSRSGPGTRYAVAGKSECPGARGLLVPALEALLAVFVDDVLRFLKFRRALVFIKEIALTVRVRP